MPETLIAFMNKFATVQRAANLPGSQSAIVIALAQQGRMLIPGVNPKEHQS